jgi:hypothetical protein
MMLLLLAAAAMHPVPTAMHMRHLASIPIGDADVLFLALSPKGKQIVIGQEGRAALMDLPKGRARWKAPSISAVFANDSKTVVLGSKEKLAVLDVQSGKQVKLLASKGGPYDDVALSLNGKFLASKDGPDTISNRQLSSANVIWQTMLPKLAPASGKLSDYVSLLPFDDGSCVVSDDMSLDGMPIQSHWLLAFVDQKGQVQSELESQVMVEALIGVLYSNAHQVAVIMSGIDWWANFFELPGMQRGDSLGLYNRQITRAMNGGGWNFLVDGDEILIAQPEGGGRSFEVPIQTSGESSARDPSNGKLDYPNEITMMAVSRDGHTLALTSGGDKLEIYQLVW